MEKEHATRANELADALEDERRELNRALDQAVWYEHLWERAGRSCFKAVQAIIAAVEDGFDEVWDTGRFVLTLAGIVPGELPELPTFKFVSSDGEHELSGQLAHLTVGDPVGPDGKISVSTAFELWRQYICPSLRSKSRVLKADAGRFDFPTIKINEAGKPLNRHGGVCDSIAVLDANSKEIVASELVGEMATDWDDYDAAGEFERLRKQVADWADACHIAESILRRIAVESRSPNSQIAYSPDFRSVNWFGTPYTFSANQSKVVAMLIRCFESGAPEVGSETLLHEIDHAAPPSRMDLVFRDSPAWKTMIVKGSSKGTYRLAHPDDGDRK